MSKIARLMEYRRSPDRVFFTRGELTQLLSLYSRQVMRGQWRDYAIGHDSGMARFAVFRHAHERPLYVIAKLPETHPGEAARKGRFVLYEGQRRKAQAHGLLDLLGRLEAPVRVVS
ncbi:DUF2794 domain-containing protein [Roseospirillum parvum]|uniref:DUF2794 domain-containing protein n=1 Tax=Roseospirillum parvum TaxID=83401 RepID=A0A1G7YJ94_9PROT|nr:DUF2794 domain-containing protein [Roseospirillum parvum]SDG96648.1 Protein of unknown function [Roseospirillum parvum]